MLNIDEKYDIIVINSFLHHILDYIKLIDQICQKLNDGGEIFTFQDPLKYDTLSKVTSLFS